MEATKPRMYSLSNQSALSSSETLTGSVYSDKQSLEKGPSQADLKTFVDEVKQVKTSPLKKAMTSVKSRLKAANSGQDVKNSQVDAVDSSSKPRQGVFKTVKREVSLKLNKHRDKMRDLNKKIGEPTYKAFSIAKDKDRAIGTRMAAGVAGVSYMYTAYAAAVVTVGIPMAYGGAASAVASGVVSGLHHAVQDRKSAK